MTDTGLHKKERGSGFSQTREQFKLYHAKYFKIRQQFF